MEENEVSKESPNRKMNIFTYSIKISRLMKSNFIEIDSECQVCPLRLEHYYGTLMLVRGEGSFAFNMTQYVQCVGAQAGGLRKIVPSHP